MPGLILPADPDFRLPDVTVRQLPNYKPGEAVFVYEAQCHRLGCGKVYGPDSSGNVSDWIERHLWSAHKMTVMELRRVKLGREVWDETRRTPYGTTVADER